MKWKIKLAGILNGIGIVAMLVCILVCIPFTIPKIFGLQIYSVVSGSMEPEYPVGSVVYVGEKEPEEVKEGDVITYHLGSDTTMVMTHRVVEVNKVAETFVTKGDANTAVDTEEVTFKRVIGAPVLCVPQIAVIADFINSFQGKIIIGAVFLGVIFLWIIAGALKKEKLTENKLESTRPKKGFGKGNIILLMVGILLIVVVLLIFFRAFLGYRKTEEIYGALSQTYVEIQQPETIKNDDAIQQDTENGDWWYTQVQVDFKQLQAVNSEVVGWIRFDNNEMINYPILYGGDNEKYLRKDLYGNSLNAGSIFIEAANNPNFTDYHTIIYGHNMKNQSMFGSLKKYREPEYYTGNEFFTIYTADGACRYQIFACQDVSETDPVYTVGYEPGEAYQEFLNQIMNRTELATGVEVTTEDKIVSLSTCATTGNRFLVHAVLIDMQEN